MFEALSYLRCLLQCNNLTLQNTDIIREVNRITSTTVWQLDHFLKFAKEEHILISSYLILY